MKMFKILLALIVLTAISPKLYYSVRGYLDFRTAETRIAEIIKKGQTNLNVGDLRYLTTIPQAVGSIKGIESVRASGTRLQNIDALSNASELKSVYLANTQISDLSPLRDSKRLETLDVGRTWIYDLTPLSELQRLRWLQMDRAAVKSLCPLQKVRSLNWINLYSSYAEDGSQKCFSAMERTIRDVGGGNSYRQNYIPSGLYTFQVSTYRFLERWGWRSRASTKTKKAG